MKETFVPSKNYAIKKWYLVDAKNKILGRVATKISKILIGKEKIAYTPFLETGDYVIVINAEQICVTGKKPKQKYYKNHSGRPGGLKIENFLKLQQRKPQKIVEHAIAGMLPKGPLGRKIYKNLKVYKGDKHPHRAQTPELLNI
jgi:large subunit ribosomal protein L13